MMRVTASWVHLERVVGAPRAVRVRSPTLVVVLVAVVLAGCASSPAVRFYDLAIVAGDAVAKRGGTLVGIGPFVMPDYLKRPQIVVRRDDQGIELAEYDRWAEAPDAAFTRWLAARIDRHLATGVAVAYPYASVGPVDHRVRGTIRRWDADARGEATLVVQWGVAAADGSPRLRLRTSTLTASIGEANDYPSIVAALGRTLDDFAAEVAGALETEATDAPP
jgi:hypothetical protein